MARSERVVVWAIIASQLGGPFMFGGVAVALPHLGRELTASATSLGLVESLFLAGSAALLLPMGRLADAGDKRSLFKLGLLSFGLTTLAIALTSWMPLLLALRFLQGVTSSLVAATGPALLAELVPPERRGRAYGLSIGSVYIGLMVGPVVAGFLVEHLGWRAVFGVGAGVIFSGLLLVHALMRSSWRTPARGSVHGGSAALVTAAVLLVVLGSASLREGALGAGGLVVGALLLVAFVGLQRRIERPLLDVGALLKNAVLRNALLAQLFVYLNAIAATFTLSLYLQVTLGHPATTAGRVLAVGSLVMAIVAPAAGALSDRTRPGAVSLFGVASVLASSLLAAVMGGGLTVPSVVGVLALQGLGYGLFSSPNMALIMGSVPPAETSMASALAASARSFGMVAGMLVIAVLISLRFGDGLVEEHPEELASLVVTTFWCLVGSTSVALVISLFSRRHR